MIKNVNRLKNFKEKKFFIEKIDIISKKIFLYASKNSIKINDDIKVDDDINNCLIQMEIFDNENSEKNHENLLKTLKKDKYKKFISSIKFYLEHHKDIDFIDIFFKEKRSLLINNELKYNKPKVVDLFCGAGGLSLGFKKAGFSIDLANDNEDVCIETFKFNHPEISPERVILGDIKDVIKDLDKLISSEIDIVVGGPPCQGFSSANQRRVLDDPRNKLYKYFIKSIEKINPKFILMENVRGILKYADEIVKDLENISIKKNKSIFSYKVGYKLLFSDDFGVAQRRPRLFFIGIRNDISSSKNINVESIFNSIDKTKSKEKHLLRDALEYIDPLRAPREKNMTEVDCDISGKKIDLNNFSGNENSYLKLINNENTVDFLFNHKARYLNDTNFKIYETLKQGEDGTAESISDFMPYKNRSHIFKDKYYKLIENKPSRTITAHLRMDCHSHIHPSQVRSITPREAARIQSFPDNYLFLGPYLKTYMQIGNAVPPLMAKAIAQTIKNALN